MPEMPDYNRFIKFLNPISIKSNWLLNIPRKKIEIKTGKDSVGNGITQIGKYQEQEWYKFQKDIESNGVRDYITLKLYKDPNGINRFVCTDGSHRIHAISNIKNKDCYIPVIFDIDTTIPLTELSEIFYLLYVSKNISHRDLSSIYDQMTWLSVNEIKTPDIKTLIKEDKIHAYDYFHGAKIYDFLKNLFSNKYKIYKKVEGIDFDWTIKRGHVIFKFADGDEIYDIDKKYPLQKPGSDNDVIRAATQAVKQCVEKISPEMMRELGLFKGFWIKSKMIYGEVQNLIPYSTNTNFIQLLSIEDEDGKVLKNKDMILKKLCDIVGVIIVTANVV